LTCRREEIGNPLVDGVPLLAGSAMEFSLKNLLLVLLDHVEQEISFADRTAENIHE
jgi:hypothetical protein